MKNILRLAVLFLAACSAALASPSCYTNGAVTGTKILVSAAPATSGNHLWSYHLVNGNASIVYLQIFDAGSTGAVTLGSTAPTMVLGIPSTANGGVVTGSFPKSFPFTNGIVIAITTTWNGSTAPGASSLVTITYE